ncbi:DUF975 family protein [Paenibacillus mesophilus]|uniref:DUF975 family protein n=1 Tax=Paenibacillus mesophilus TaxID=2582849 RepID=UPI00110D881A|nr:DUF975 family protein [Paenibacillus mesophilus]TMV46238.1 DUF975 family protein [Paenibacillus mesophilus]
MWTRKELKERAWQSLRATYWKAFLVSLLLALIGGGLPSCSWNSGGERGFDGDTGSIFGSGEDIGIWVTIIVILVLIGIFVVIAAFAFQVLLVSPLIVGIRQYFKQAAQDDVNMNYIGYAFAKNNYWSVVKGMLWKDFLNFLWYLLLLVPGFVKFYSYSLVPYLLADNPRIGTKRAVELSRKMMHEQKWRTFVLDLSFIGWFLLGMLALLLGILFVLPYFNATKAELYITLRDKAIQEGISSREELGL